MTLTRRLSRRAASATMPPEPRAALLNWLGGQWHACGAARDRAGSADLYYTAFALLVADALGRAHPPATEAYLHSFDRPGELDRVHLAALARARALTAMAPEPLAGAVDALPPAQTVYDLFLAWGAAEDAGRPTPAADHLAALLDACRRPTGGLANQPDLPVPAVPPTAAGLLLARQAGLVADPRDAEWLAAQTTAAGGLRVHPLTDQPDLLATGVGLFALAETGRELPADRADAARGYVFGCRTPSGGWGARADDAPDVEYTFYALLALGSAGG